MNKHHRFHIVLSQISTEREKTSISIFTAHFFRKNIQYKKIYNILTVRNNVAGIGRLRKKTDTIKHSLRLRNGERLVPFNPIRHTTECYH